MEKLLSISEASKLMGVCDNTLRDWDIENKFKATRTEGGHRRYSLEQVREYINKHPIEELDNNQNVSKNQFKILREKWAKDLIDVENEKDKMVLAVLIENGIRYQKIDSKFSSSQLIWLIKNIWLKSRFKNLISVTPLSDRVGLVYYKNLNKKCLTIYSEAIVAKTFSYNFKAFANANFDNVKEAYVEAAAWDIDMFILQYLPTITDITSLAESVFPSGLQVNQSLKQILDFIIAPKAITDNIEKENPNIFDNIELFDIPTILDDKTYMPKVHYGKYPTDILVKPIFAPYNIFYETPIIDFATVNVNKILGVLA